VSASGRRSFLSRVEGVLWTGPAAHLLGGTLDIAEAIARHLLRRART
jgi:hypothetical protein